MMRVTGFWKPILIVTGLLVTNNEVAAQLAYFVNRGSWFALSVYCGIWAASLGAVIYTAYTPRDGARLLWLIVIGMSTLLAKTYYLGQRFPLTLASLDQMNARTVMAARNEAVNPDQTDTGLLAALDPALLLALGGTALLVAGLMMGPPRWERLRPAYLGMLPLVPLLLLAGLAVYVGSNRGDELRGMPGQFSAAGVLLAYAVSPRPDTAKREVAFDPVRAPSARRVVLIVDESVAGDFVDLNRQRGTTPWLQANQGSLINYGLALAAHNCSENANAVLRLGASPGQIGNGDDPIINNPSIWKYAAAAGFETTLISTQFPPESRLNHVNAEELALIDHLEGVSSSVPGEGRDLAGLDMLARSLARPGRQFVLFVKHGAHSPFPWSYPANRSVFEPAMRRGEKISDRERLVNSYKNAIHWSVDRFFERLFERGVLQDFVLIYTSDHGQNLLDDGEPITHCRRSGQTLAEAIVPLLVWSDRDGLEDRFRAGAQVNRDAASHFQVFPTLLDLFGYAPEAVRRNYYPSLFEPVSEPLGFASGPIMGRFGSRATWNDHAGMESFRRAPPE